MPTDYLKEIFQSSDDPAKQFGHTKLGLTQGERELFESADFDYAGGSILKREARESDLPEYLRIDSIMRRTKMDRKKALLYRKYLTRIGPRLYRTFEDWMKKRGVDEGLRYFRYLSMQLHQEDTPSSDYLENRESDSYTPDYWYPVEDNKTPWLIKQPNWVRNFVMRPDTCKNLKGLRALGKSCYDAEQTERRTPVQKQYLGLTHAQQSVFWTNYSMQKARLEHELKLGPTARKIIQRIENAPAGRIPYIGAMLYKMQKGEVEVKEPLTEDEWRRVWGVYNRCKEEVRAPPDRGTAPG